MRVNGARIRVLLVAALVTVASITPFIQFEDASAAQITARQLKLEKNSGVVNGGSAPSAVGGAGSVGTANHHFTFSIPTTASIRSFKFDYCTTASGTCTAPTDLTAASTTLGATVGLTSPTRTAAVSAPYVTVTANPSATVQITLDAIKNPSAINSTFFVRISTYTSSNATTGLTDTGVVAASTSRTLTVSGTMPEYLQFCTGEAITVTANIPDCSTATDGAIDFATEFSPSSTSVATSMMSAATNAISGYAITVTGTTLTSGSNTIPAQGTSAIAANTSRGTSKFAINLVANTTTTSTPAVGAALNPVSNGTDLRGLATAAYSTPDSYALDLTGATSIANSDNTTPGSAVPTNPQAYTVTYIANVSGIQPPGTYVATLNYVCTPTY